MLKDRVLSVAAGIFVMVLSTSHANAQTACSSLEGTWSDSGTVWNLSQDSNKTVTGTMTNLGGGYCPGGNTWVVTGRVGSSGGDYRVVAVFNPLITRPETCTGTITLDGTISKPGCNRASGAWTNSNSNPNTNHGNFNHSTSCKVPSGETTPEFVEWGTPGHGQTIGRFRQELPPGGFNYGGRYIQEFFLSDTIDTCFRPNNPIPQIVLMPSKPKIHLSDQEPAAYSDFVGMTEQLVIDLRRLNVSPCGYYLKQRMKIDCDYGEVVYKVNDLELSQGPLHVASARGPTRAQKPWGSPPPSHTVIPIIINLLLEQ